MRLRRFEIATRLNVHPERSAGLEEFAEPQRSVGGDRLVFARDDRNDDVAGIGVTKEPPGR